MDRSKRGSSMTPVFPRRERTRSVWRVNIAGSSASRITAKSRYPCRLPITTPVCRQCIVSICRRNGRQIRNVGAKRAVPKEISFKTKPEIALEQIEAACRAGVPRGVVLMDAGYGCNTDLRTSISTLALTYVAGILPNTTVWTSDTAPLPPKKWSGKGRPPTLLRRDHKHQPISVKELALWLPKRVWRTFKWREGAAERVSSRFARARFCVAHRDYQLTESRPEEWLLIEGPEGEDEPTKYWLSTLPETITFGRLVDLTKLRWRIERDYQDLKQEVGLGHFEGRGWRGFHHHATLCIAAYGFLVSERETIPPSGSRSTRPFKRLAISNGYRPRGSAAATRTSHPELDCDDA